MRHRPQGIRNVTIHDMGTEGTHKALESYFNRLNRKKRKNGKPEDSVNAQLEAWFKMHGFSMVRVESKATYSKAQDRYTRNETPSGASDWMGCTASGLGSFVEAKAPGKRHSLKPHQRIFLLEKIERGAFAVCVDSVENLDAAWSTFKHIPHVSDRIIFLLEHLPKETTPRKPRPKDPELGF